MNARIEIGRIDVVIDYDKHTWGEPISLNVQLASNEGLQLETELPTLLDELRDQLETKLVIGLVGEVKGLRRRAKSSAAQANLSLETAEKLDADLDKISDAIAKGHEEEL